MAKQLTFIFIVLGFCLAPTVQATNVIWVSDRYEENGDGVADDVGWVDFLTSQGYTVDYREGPALGDGYWRTLDNAKIAELNAADVIIVARSTDSGNYATDATEAAQWNGITAPMILTTPYFSRNNRWIWYNNTTLQEDSGTPTLVAQDPHHPIFQGIDLNAQDEVEIYDQSVGSATVSLVGVLDNGNGSLIARAKTGNWTMIAEWQAGTPFYAGGAEIAAGKRMLFCGGTREGGGQGRGEFNLNEQGQKLLVNAIEYMVGNLVREPWVKAWQPDPADGTRNVTIPLLRWTPGETALFHNVYVGTSPELTEADLRSSQQPLALYYHTPGLTPGTTYYWRVDEIEADGTTHTGDVWSFSSVSLIANEPLPRDGAKWLDPSAVTLEWQPGQNALTHDVYFGTDKTAVTEGTDDTSRGNQIASAFDPGVLEQDTTYYWRVDEVMADGTKRTGAVWTFSTLGPGGGLRGLYYANASLSGDPAINQIDPQINFNWADAAPAGLPVDGFSVRWIGEIDVPFTDTYTFYTNTDDGVRLWVNDIQLMDLWSNRRSATEAKASIHLEGGQKYPVVMEFYNAEGTAVAELRWESRSIAKDLIPQPAFSLALRASGPSPGNGAADVPQTSTLSWSAGEMATHHDVYFGADRTAVAQATSETAAIYQGRQTVDDATFDPGPLEWGKTYYWRIDEVDASEADSPWQGSVWSFTAADFIVADNFENYTDVEGERIYQTWIDGYTNGNSNSIVGYFEAPFAERTIVHSGKQSMPLEYNNVNTPFYSEAEREFSPAQDWTVNGVTDLVLYVRGRGNNGADTLYVAVEDSSGNLAVVPTGASLTSTTWAPVSIPLSQFTGVDLARIEKLYLGVGDRNAPKAGGAGLIYIDDIRVAKPEPAE